MKRFRYLIIIMLDKNPKYCWANLVMWAEGYRSFWSLFFKNHQQNDYKEQICRKKYDTPCAYCGKCEITGRFYL